MTQVVSWARREWPFLLGLGLSGVAIAIVNPLREMAYVDDWAYALTVRSLLETGLYRLSDAALANPIFQTYWGALFARVMGYSFVSLRISTVVLLTGGLAGLYMLGRELNLKPHAAALVVVIFVTNPLTLMLGTSFMTDVPFLSCVILGLALYTRALRTRSYSMMLVGSAFVLAAILTRSFGIVFLPALGLSFLIDRNKRENLALYGAGLILPLTGLAWLAIASVTQQSIIQSVMGKQEISYISNLTGLLPAVTTRIVVYLEDLGFLSLPILPAALLDYGLALRAEGGSPWRGNDVFRKVTIAAPILVFVALVVGAGLLVPPINLLIPVMAGLYIDVLTALPMWLRVLVTVAALACAFTMMRTFILRTLRSPSADAHYERLLDYVVLFLGLGLLLYIQSFERYLLSLLPFVLILLARQVGDSLNHLRWPTWAIVTALLVPLALSVAGRETRDEILWRECEMILAQGVKPQQIDCSPTWSGYHGSWDRYLQAHLNGFPDDVAGSWWSWVDHEAETATYTVRFKRPPNGYWDLVKTIPYRGMMFSDNQVYVYSR